MHGTSVVIENTAIAERTFRLVVSVSEEVPPIAPGQFAMLRLPNRSDPLLGRPLAVYRQTRSARTTLLEFVYLVVGKMTARLAEVRPNDRLEIWTPLGKGFKVDEVQRHILVAGGIGQTPFLMLAEQYPNSTLLYGARTEARIACMEDFDRIGIDIRIATDDGSRGHHGAVTELIPVAYRPGEPTKIIACGPKPMLQATFCIAKSLGLPCDVSLESPMSCGLGICFSCVVEYRSNENSEEWDYCRTCIDGPAFDAYRLKWDDPPHLERNRIDTTVFNCQQIKQIATDDP